MLIGGFHPFSLCDFPGRPAAVVFAQGCNYRCPYCHNRSLWPRAPRSGSGVAEGDVLGVLRRRRDRLGGVVVTGGEPTLQPDLPDFIGALRAMGFAIKLDTNGSRPGVVAALLAASLVDFVAMDVKAPPEKYPALCGRAVDVDAVHATVALLSAGTVAHHFRTTLYPPLLSAGDLPAVRALLPPGAKHRVQAFRDPGAGGYITGPPVETSDELKKSSILL